MNTKKTKCSCFEDNLSRVKGHLIEQKVIPEGAIDVDVKWKERIYSLSGSDIAPVNPKIEFEYRAPKKAGGHVKNIRKDDVAIYANYCCFCGRKYQKSND